MACSPKRVTVSLCKAYAMIPRMQKDYLQNVERYGILCALARMYYCFATDNAHPMCVLQYMRAFYHAPMPMRACARPPRCDPCMSRWRTDPPYLRPQLDTKFPNQDIQGPQYTPRPSSPVLMFSSGSPWPPPRYIKISKQDTTGPQGRQT